MRITANRADLHTALRRLKPSIPQRPVRPILNCVLLRATDDPCPLLTAEGTDLTTGVRADISMTAVEEGGDAAVPYHALLAALDKLGGESVVITTKNGRCRVRAANASVSMAMQDAEDFPTVGGESCPLTVTLSADDIKAAIRKAGVAETPGLSKHGGHGVLFEAGQDRVVIASAGNTRVSLLTIHSKPRVEARAVLPLESFKQVAAFLADADDEVEVFVGASNAHFSTPAGSIWCRRCEWEFPKWEKMLPKNFEGQAEVDRQGLLDAFNVAALATSEDTMGATVTFSDGKVSIATQTEGADADVELAADYTGGEFTVRLNVQLVLDFLRAATGESVSVSWTAPEKALVFDDGPDFRYAVQPIVGGGKA